METSLIKKALFTVIAVFWVAILSGTGGCAHNQMERKGLPDKELNRLDKLLQDSKEYDSRRTHGIDSLRQKLNGTSPDDVSVRYNLLLDIAGRYRTFCSDSSVMFYARAYELGKELYPGSPLIDIRINLINALASSGIFSAAEKLLESLDTLQLTPAQKLEQAAAGRQLYSYMRGYLDDENEFTPVLTYKFKDYDEYLRENLPDSDPYRLFLVAERQVRSGRNKEARNQLDVLLKKLKMSDNLYGMVAFQCAQASKNLGDDYEYGRYLALSAMSDVEGSVKETLALPALAEWLYDKGDIDRAYRYINASLNNATASNSRMRTVAIANFVPIIDNSYRHKISASRDELMIYFVLVAILMVVSASLFFIFLRNLRRSNRIRRRLQTQTKMQENYIGHFLSLCATYADQLESTRRLVSRKIAAGQTDELLKLLKNSRNAENQTDDFFKVFDETFLDLYPDFIEKFNALLRPEEQIAYVKGSPLSTELRIYAFVRLGVQESVRIAQILRCSVSTIYTYRNRMRGRALNRETFEADVASLGQENLPE